MSAPRGVITFITVTFNSEATAVHALRSARRAATQAGLDAQLIVVDNASVDQTVSVLRTAFPDAVLIENESNVGFAVANNQAFGHASGFFWMLLNPDAALEPSSLGPLIAELHQRSSAAVVAPSIGERSQAESAGMLPSLKSVAGHFLYLNRLLIGDRGGAWRGFQLHRRLGLGPRRVEWASASAVMVRPEAVREVGGFDPSFFLYGEDLDLGRRLARAGWDLWLVPASRAVHAIAGSQPGGSTRWIDAIHHHYAQTANTFALIALDLSIALGLGLRAAATVTAHTRSRRRTMTRAALRAAHLAMAVLVGRDTQLIRSGGMFRESERQAAVGK
jgi:N-acetylglucosaminyl-diphospho-decaprenol L-rhamnosyltransferase